MSTLKGFFLGRIDFLINEKSISHLLSQKAKGLLCYLIMNHNQPHNRDKLAEIFWGNSSKESARYNLRYTLWSLRKGLNSTAKQQKYFLMPEKNLCQFNAESDVWVDIFEFYELSKKAKEPGLSPDERIRLLNRASALYQGEFLEGFYVKASSSFDDWIFFQRETAQRTYFEVQKSISELYSEKKDYSNAIASLKKLLAINPLQEDIYYELIKLYYISGNRSGAIREYQNCCKVLREELNIRPMNKIQELYNNILKEEEINKTKKNTVKPSSEDQNLSFMLRILDTENKDIKIVFYTTTNYDRDYVQISKLIRQYQEKNPCLNISTSCLPGPRIQFEGLQEIMIDILKKYPASIQQIPGWCIFEIRKIVPQFQIDLPFQRGSSISNPQIEKLRVFSAAAKIIESVAGQQPLLLNFTQIHSLDRVTLEFIPFLFRQYHDKDFMMIGINDSNKDEKNIDYLRRIYKGEKQAVFIDSPGYNR